MRKQPEEEEEVGLRLEIKGLEVIQATKLPGKGHKEAEAEVEFKLSPKSLNLLTLNSNFHLYVSHNFLLQVEE